MLDIDFGTYPYVTSSNCTSGGALTGSGIGIGYIEGIVAIIKAYTTRVGEGPFVTELFDEISTTIREKAHEYGVVTHRPRRIGWLDLVQLRFSQNVNGFKHGALMLFDILSGLGDIKVCTAYELDGKIIDYVPASLKETYRCKPIYKTFKGWNEDISKCKTYDELPQEAQLDLTKKIQLFAKIFFNYQFLINQKVIQVPLYIFQIVNYLKLQFDFQHHLHSILLKRRNRQMIKFL